MPEGLKITLSGLGRGLTVDLRGRQLLPAPFVFQCPPLEEFKVTNAFSMGNYDTLEEGQFTRRGGRQLKVWQFDTLVMEVGVNESSGRPAPRWVPFARYDAPGRPTDMRWYVDHLQALHDAGAPFNLVAQFQTEQSLLSEAAHVFGPALATPAVLLGFSETHKHGEGDAIYLEGVSFSEWRDPTVTQRALGKGGGHPAETPPTTVVLRRDGTCTTPRGHVIPHQPSSGVKTCTLTDLSKFFYHDTMGWRELANANGLRGGGGNTPLLKFPKYKKIPPHGVKIKIPAERSIGTAVSITAGVN